MQINGNQIQVSEREASNIPRQPHNVRIVLAVSMALTVATMSLAWMIPALA